MSLSKKIETRNNQYSLLAWSELKNYDCNTLKELENRDISKLKNAIVNSKFSFPFYIWKRYVVDGAGRMQALLELEAEGYEIPDLPIIEIEAENKREAKKLVLQASSQHGKVSQESFDSFIEDLELDPFEFEELNFTAFQSEESPDIDYSNKNKEVDLNDLGDEGRLILKFDYPEHISSYELQQVGSFPLDYNFLDIQPKYLIGMSVPPVMMAQVAYQAYLQLFTYSNS